MRHSSANGAEKVAGKVKNALIQLGNLSGFSWSSLRNWMGSRFLRQVRTGTDVVVAVGDSCRSGHKAGFASP